MRGEKTKGKNMTYLKKRFPTLYIFDTTKKKKQNLYLLKNTMSIFYSFHILHIYSIFFVHTLPPKKYIYTKQNKKYITFSVTFLR